MPTSYSKELAAITRAMGTAFGPRARDEYESRIAPLIASGLVAGRRLMPKTPVVPKKSGLGGFIAAGFGVALVAGVAYLAWQVLRTDDEAWVDDDFDVD
jgi:hypothetical protein